MQLVACVDTLNAGVHFPADTQPDALGWKALAVNLSDLAAMGAQPCWALLSLSLPSAETPSVDELILGLTHLARLHGMALVGGDTTRGPLSLTVTALGQVPAGTALVRSGARVGDAIVVTGTLGDAAAGLMLAMGQVAAPSRAAGEMLRKRLDYPTPRIAAGTAMRGIASACIDVSDGLLADLGHVCAASGVGVQIDIEAVPLSAEILSVLPRGVAQRLALSGGDDYELCVAVPRDHLETALAALRGVGCAPHIVGRVTAEPGVQVLDAAGMDVTPRQRGYEHFS